MVKDKKKPRRKRKNPGKGSAFERKTCKLLSQWLSGNGDDMLFWRSALSGGRATNLARFGKRAANQEGDLSPIHSKGEALTNLFWVECKHYRDLGFESSLMNGHGKLLKFWHELVKHSGLVGKMPMLICKQNRSKTWVVLDSKGLLLLFARTPKWVVTNRGMNILQFRRLLRLPNPIKILKAYGGSK